MQVVVLCGGKGTRLSEYTDKIPKPLIEVGGKPILMHIMEIYSHYGHNEFILCLGYKGDKIREYLDGRTQFNIKFVDTGESSNKTERIIKIKEHIADSDFFVTYGDDLSDVDINDVLKFHKNNNKIVTLTAVNLESPFGVIEINKKSEVISFREKPKLDCLINGGFYVFNKKIFEHLNPKFELEKENFEELAKKKLVAAYYHKGFWKSMNTLKDVVEINEMFTANKAKWLRK